MEMKSRARVIIRKAIRTHGRTKVRALIKAYKATRPDYQQAIEEAFAEFARGQR